MAYAPNRSANLELNKGATEGSYRTIAPNRGGFVESLNGLAKTELAPEHYGPVSVEEKVKRAPDGLLHTSHSLNCN
jgi:hypothetical protein